jgi:hypothetical protein
MFVHSLRTQSRPHQIPHNTHAERTTQKAPTLNRMAMMMTTKMSDDDNEILVMMMQ